jgi:nitroreductase
MPDDMGLFEAIYTTRAIRRFTDAPVPPSLLRKVLEAAAQGPSGMNRQPWRFIIIQSAEKRRAVGKLYEEGFFANRGDAERATADTNPSAYLALHMGDAPVIVVVTTYLGKRPGVGTVGAFASTYPGIQNLLLAARAVGLGGTITTNHMLRHDEMKAELGIPDERQIIALVPLGFPAESHGPKSRMPIEEVAFTDSWGEPLVLG